MKKHLNILLPVSFILLTYCGQKLAAQPSLDIETGLVSAGYNDVRIPGDNGSLVSFTDDLSSSAAFFYRIRVGYKISGKNNISILAAPLLVKSDGTVPSDINFSGTVFPAGSKLDTRYKFNSYRLTYRYDFVRKDNIEFGLGITAKLRDAAIEMRSPSLFAEKTNTGFVPLINFRLLVDLVDKLGILMEGDALAAKQGRAEDVLVSLQYGLNDNMYIRAGYRLLEGGADNDEVYNFSLFNYGSLGFTYSF